MDIGKKTVFIGDINSMAKFMVPRNTNHLTGGVSNKHFRGLVVDEMRK